MARDKGTFNFAANFEVLAKAPLDARLIVQQKSDLQLSTTWEDSNGAVWLYTGIVVSVVADSTPSNNGLYFLLDNETYTLSTSWIKIGTGEISAWNGLTAIDTSIGLGGNLIQNTSIQLNNHDLIIDGSGFKYAQDNTPFFTTRSIVDKGYVDEVVGNSIKGYSGTFIGDGIETSFDIHHNLNTLNQSITIYESNGLMTYPDLERGLNTDTIIFFTPPEVGVEFSIVILGFTSATGKGYEETIYGDDVTTSFNVTHNLGTMSQTITAYDQNDSIIYPDLQRGSNVDIITFFDPPVIGENYSIVIIGF